MLSLVWATLLCLDVTFLKQNRAIIDLGAQTVEFFGYNVIPFLDHKGPSTPLPVHCGQTHVIDAHSEAVTPATVAIASSNVVGSIEPGEKLLDRYHLAGAASLVCPNVQGSIPFRLLNPTDTPITVYRGATLGHLFQADFDILPLGNLSDYTENTSAVLSLEQTLHDDTLAQSSVDPSCSPPSPPQRTPTQQPETNKFRSQPKQFGSLCC